MRLCMFPPQETRLRVWAGDTAHPGLWELDGPSIEQKGVIGVGGEGPRTGAGQRLSGRSPRGRTPERPLSDSRGTREWSPGQPLTPSPPPVPAAEE